MIATAKIDKTGRILVPLKLRRALGLSENSVLILKVEGGELRIHTREAAMLRARDRLKRLKKPGDSVVDEFLSERRAAAKRELTKLDR